MKKILLTFLIIQFYHCINVIPDIPIPDIPIPDIPIPSFIQNTYKLNIKNENGKNKIELKPGTFSKIIIQLTVVFEKAFGSLICFILFIFKCPN